MKKKGFFALAAVLSLTLLTGCQGQPTQTETNGKTEGTQTEASEAGQSGSGGRLAKIQEAGKIVMGTSPDYAPSEFEDISSGKKEYVGCDIELGKYIAEQLGVELEIKAMEFSAIQQAVASGTVDMGISGFAYTDERAEALLLSTPYNLDSNSGQGLLVRKDEADQYQSAEAFSGKKVGTQNASLQQKLAQEQLPSDAQLQLIASLSDGVLMLSTGKIDALAVAGENGKSLSKSYPDVVMAEFMFDYTSGGNVIAMKKGEDELAAAVNGIIEEVNEKGYYGQWKEEAIALADSLGIEIN